MTYAYHVFAGSTYYPAGGYGDYIGSFLTLEEARYQATRHEIRSDGQRVPEHDWWQIVRSQEGSLALVKVEEGAL